MTRYAKRTLPLSALLLVGVVGCDAAMFQGILTSELIMDLVNLALQSAISAI